MQITREEPDSLRERVEVIRTRFKEYDDSKRVLAGRNQQLVISVARDYVDRGVSAADLVRAGNQGLFRAVDAWDFRSGTQFGAYATPLIRGAIERTILDQTSDERLETPNEMSNIPIEELEAVLNSLTYREREIIKLRYGMGDGYVYTVEEVGRVFKVTRQRVRQIEAKFRDLLRLPRLDLRSE